MHRHGHLGQVFADVVPEDVPQADGAVVGAWCGQTGSALTKDAAFLHRAWQQIV